MKKLLIACALGTTSLSGAAVAQDAAPASQTERRRDPMAMIDTDGDGKVTRAEATAAADTMFGRMDANGDGTLSGEELRPRRGGRPGLERPRPNVEPMQTDRNGQVNAPERGARPPRMGMGRGMLAAADANGDGIVTREEAGAAAARQFDRADANRDGTIDAAEREATRAQMRPRRSPQANGN